MKSPHRTKTRRRGKQPLFSVLLRAAGTTSRSCSFVLENQMSPLELTHSCTSSSRRPTLSALSHARKVSTKKRKEASHASRKGSTPQLEDTGEPIDKRRRRSSARGIRAGAALAMRGLRAQERAELWDDVDGLESPIHLWRSMTRTESFESDTEE